MAKEKPVPVRTLKLDTIVRRPEFQVRVLGTNPDHVKDIQESIRNGDKIKPLPRVVLVLGQGPILVRGFHTVEALEAEGVQEYRFEVLEGDLDLAKEEAATSNNSEAHVKGPLKMSRADKRNAAEKLLDLYPKMSADKIAAKLNYQVSDQLILDIKRERRIANGEQPDDSEERAAARKAKAAKKAKDRAKTGAEGDPAEEVESGHDFGEMKAALATLAKQVQKVVNDFPGENMTPVHRSLRKALDSIDTLLFDPKTGWQKRLTPKGS